MKRVVMASVLAALLAGVSGSAFAQVGVGITVGDPNFYGRINIGAAPPPVIYDRPVVISGAPSGPPLYLRVPAGYERDWRHHCAAYHACGRPVYFVRDDWYRDHYYQERREHWDRWEHDHHDHDRDHHD